MKLKNIIKNNLYLLKLVLKYTPGYFYWSIFYNAIRGFSLSMANVLFLKILFNNLEAKAPFTNILMLIGIYSLYQVFISWLYSWYWKYYSHKVQHTLHGEIHSNLFRKVMQMDLECYDDPAFYTDFVWAMQGADERVNSVMDDFGRLVNEFASLLTVIGVLLTIDKYVFVILVVSIGISFGLQQLLARISVKRTIELKPLERKADYINRVFYLRDYAAEIRLSKISDLFQKSFVKVVADIQKTHRKYHKSMFAISSIKSSLAILLSEMGVTTLLVYRMFIQRTISMGDFAASVNSIWRLTGNVNNIIDCMAKFLEHSLYAEKLITFMEYQPKIQNAANPVKRPDSVTKIELRDIHFTYKGQDKPAVKGISLKIGQNQKIALVGYNGAGKSTLVKLLLRLYDVSQGEIRLNNINIKEFDVTSYREGYGCIFQDYQIYAAKVSENVAMDTVSAEDSAKILKALNYSGFDARLAKMEKGIESHLTREYDESGIILSGGENQKIAIARIFVDNYPVIILDEPTSALDVLSEYELNKVIMEILKDKIVIFISHRLSTTRMADVIYMLENGEIIEQGSHAELMARNGKYAEMFNLQAEKYRLGSI